MSATPTPPLDEAATRAAVKAALAVKADDVIVNIRASESAFTRYAVNEVTTSGEVGDVVTTVSCALGRRHASVEVHSVDPAEVASAARRALELASIAPEDPELVASPGPSTMRPVKAAWTPEVVTAEDRAQLVSDAIAEAKRQRLVAFGFAQSGRRSYATATRNGFFGLHHDTSMDLSTTVRTPDGGGSGWAVSAGVARKEVDALAATRVACEKALRSHGPKPLEPGDYAVVLEPAAVAALLAMMSLDARAADEGRSPFSKAGGGTRVGEKVFGELTLRSDPWSPLLPTAPFDEQGMARPPVTWVEHGALKRLRTSRYWAKRTQRPADASYGALLPSGPQAQSTEALVEGLERGLLITRLWYIRMLDPQQVTVTGLTRDGVFLVEKGKIVGPVSNMRFNQSVVRMFADADGYGPPTRVLDSYAQPLVSPALRCTSFHLSSRSDAV